MNLDTLRNFSRDVRKLPDFPQDVGEVLEDFDIDFHLEQRETEVFMAKTIDLLSALGHQTETNLFQKSIIEKGLETSRIVEAVVDLEKVKAEIAAGRQTSQKSVKHPG